MSTKSRLDKLYKTCPRIRLPEDAKILFVSDLHMGDGGPEDDFTRNEQLCWKIINGYFDNGFWIVLNGDIEDIWEASIKEKIWVEHSDMIDLFLRIEDDKRLIRIKGNHDNSLDYPGAIVLQIGDLEIFCCHGHHGDLFNDRLWWIGQNVVRYLWVPLQWLGLHDVQRAEQKRHEQQEKRLVMWANDQSFISVFGHTHLLADIGKYKNSGSWVRMGGEGITFEDGKFETKKF